MVRVDRDLAPHVCYFAWRAVPYALYVVYRRHVRMFLRCFGACGTMERYEAIPLSP